MYRVTNFRGCANNSVAEPATSYAPSQIIPPLASLTKRSSLHVTVVHRQNRLCSSKLSCCIAELMTSSLAQLWQKDRASSAILRGWVRRTELRHLPR